METSGFYIYFFCGGTFRLSVCKFIKPLLMQPFTGLHPSTIRSNFALNANNALLLCTKSCIVWRKIGVWRNFRWKSIKRKSLKLLGLSKSFRLFCAQIGNLLLNRLHRGDTFRNRLTTLRDASQSHFHLHSRYS